VIINILEYLLIFIKIYVWFTSFTVFLLCDGEVLVALEVGFNPAMTAYIII
jgi:hypothetical protein